MTTLTTQRTVLMLKSCAAITLLAALLAVGCTRADQSGAAVTVHIRGVSHPLALSATKIQLSDDVQVIGVVIDGKARAYLVDALSLPVNHVFDPRVPDERLNLLSRHVVNDHVNGLAISVTYCERTACTQVFTATQSEPLDLSVSGHDGRSLQLQWEQTKFAQDSADPPLETFPYEVTRWGQWRTDHPQTDIYVGHLLPHVAWDG